MTPRSDLQPEEARGQGVVLHGPQLLESLSTLSPSGVHLDLFVLEKHDRKFLGRSPEDKLLERFMRRATTRSKDDEFYITLVTFEVQSVLFRVPVEAFETGSEAFRDMFSLPVVDEVEEGRSDDSPIVLKGVEVEDFKALLRFLCPKKLCTSIVFSQKEWLSIHRLADMWGFEDAKAASKNVLVKMDDAITKLELAVQYEYKDWLRLAYKELAYRPSSLSTEEAKRIGFQATSHIARLRYARLEAQLKHQVLRINAVRSLQCPHCATYLFMHSSIAFRGEERSRTHKCKLCGIIYYEEQKYVDAKISRKVDDEIELIVPNLDKSGDTISRSSSPEFIEELRGGTPVWGFPDAPGQHWQADFGGWGQPQLWNHDN